jgi:WD40 repeat protein
VALRDTNSGSLTVLPGLCATPREEECRRTFTLRRGVLPPRLPYPEFISAIGFTADGALLAVGGRSGAVSIWNVELGEVMATWMASDPRLDSVVGLGVHPDGAFLAAFVDSFGSDRLGVRTLDGELVVEKELDVNPNGSGHVAFSPSGSLLAVGGARLTVLRTEDWETVWDVNAHDGGVYHLDFSPDGSKLATTGSDGFVRVWDAASGTLLQVIDLDNDWAKGLAFLDDNYLVIGTSHGLIATLTLDLGELVSIARDRITRDLTGRECELHLHLSSCPPD